MSVEKQEYFTRSTPSWAGAGAGAEEAATALVMIYYFNSCSIVKDKRLAQVNLAFHSGVGVLIQGIQVKRQDISIELFTKYNGAEVSN